jgi:group I intron endonuclease
MSSFEHHIVYKTTNQVNGKIYVGQHRTNDLNDGYMGSGTALMNAMKFYGSDKFVVDILERCTEADIDSREMHWIDKLNACDRSIGYNIAEGGLGGGHPHTEESRKKISEALKGRVFSKEWKDGLSRSRKMRVTSEETRKKLSEVHTGRKRDKSIGDKISKANKGRTVGEEGRRNMSEGRKGMKLSEEHKKKIGDAFRGKPQKKVTCPHCGKVGGISPMKGYHFENCKLKN